MFSAAFACKNLGITSHKKGSRIHERLLHHISTSDTAALYTAPACKNLGAAMREIDTRGKIRGDFVLVHGNVVSTIKLEPILEAHKHRSVYPVCAVLSFVSIFACA